MPNSRIHHYDKVDHNNEPRELSHLNITHDDTALTLAGPAYVILGAVAIVSAAVTATKTLATWIKKRVRPNRHKRKRNHKHKNKSK